MSLRSQVYFLSELIVCLFPCFQIDKQFGYFSKDAVQVEDVHTATEKVVATQVGLISLMQFSWREFKSFMIINAGDCVAE